MERARLLRSHESAFYLLSSIHIATTLISVLRVSVIPTPVICIIVSIINCIHPLACVFLVSWLCVLVVVDLVSKAEQSQLEPIKQGLDLTFITLVLVVASPFTLYCSNAGLKNLPRPPPPISSLLGCSIRSVLAGQLCTDYISTLVVGRAR